jgi:hypothetical protein
MRSIISLIALAGMTQVAMADRNMLSRLTADYFPAPAGTTFIDTVNVSEGFETLVPGAINGQAGYTVFAANAAAPVVSTANPAGGAQHLRVSKGLGTNSSLNGAFTPDYGDFTNKSNAVSFDFFGSHLGGADAHMIAQAPSQSFLSWRMNFNFQGNIFVLDNIGAGLAFIDTGADWTPGAYHNVRVEMNSAANSIQYFYNNTLIYTSVAGIFAGTAVEQVILGSDNFYNQGEFIDYDNLNIVPAPATGALLAFGLLAAGRRRR